MATANRREKKRIPARFKVDYIHEEDYIISFSKDISVDGMFIRTESPPEVGQKITIKFPMDDGKKIKVSAHVVWVNMSGAQKDYGMGVKFIKPSAALRQDILKAVNKVAVLNGIKT